MALDLGSCGCTESVHPVGLADVESTSIISKISYEAKSISMVVVCLMNLFERGQDGILRFKRIKTNMELEELKLEWNTHEDGNCAGFSSVVFVMTLMKVRR